jgi:3-methyladenine DNA glycosylase AlkD
MPASQKATSAKTAKQKTKDKPKPTMPRDPVQAALAWLAAQGTRRDREGMARYGIVARKVFGVSVAKVRQLAKRCGRDHALAEGLWQTGWFEARLLAAFVDEPQRVSAAQMDRWARDFENWADCDTVCFHLFDQTPHAWRKVVAWSRRRGEFVKRAAFALLASLALHDRRTEDAVFAAFLPLVEGAAGDPRNFVKKAVLWALRGIGGRSRELNAAALEVAGRLRASPDSTARWVGSNAQRELKSPAAKRRLAARGRAGPGG